MATVVLIWECLSLVSYIVFLFAFIVALPAAGLAAMVVGVTRAGPGGSGVIILSCIYYHILTTLYLYAVCLPCWCSS